MENYKKKEKERSFLVRALFSMGVNVLGGIYIRDNTSSIAFVRSEIRAYRIIPQKKA